MVIPSIFTQKKYTFGLKFQLLGCSHVGSFFANEEQKRCACAAFDTFATHASLVYNVTETDCLAVSRFGLVVRR